MNNGPEDLFLEELVRNLKWKAAQKQQATHFRQRQQPQLTDIRLLDEDDYAEQDDKVLFQPRIEQPFQQPFHQRREEQKNFAYRPHDDRFRNNQHRPPVEPVRQIKTINPLIQSAGTRIFFSYFPTFVPFDKRSHFAKYKGGRAQQPASRPFLICDRGSFILYSSPEHSSSDEF